MTTVSRSFRYPESAQAIDVRCSAGLPDHREPQGRCQLFAGHDGPHAVMFARGPERFVRTWETSARSVAAAPAESSVLQRPWMFGYPTPAWFEDDAADEPAAGRTG